MSKPQTLIGFAIAGGVLGALAGLVADLAGLVRSSGLLLGSVVGLVLGVALGRMQARHDAASGAPAPKHAGYMSLGVVCLLLSAFAFVGALLVPGVRPLILESVPIHVDRAESSRLKFTADASGNYALLIAMKTGSDLGAMGAFLKDKSKKEEPALDKNAFTWTVEPPTEHNGDRQHTFESGGDLPIHLGSIKAESGKTYTVTVTTVKPSVPDQKHSPRAQVHRTMTDWAKAFPRVLGAGAIGVVAGITGMMLLAYGGLLLFNSKQVAAAKDAP